jgi:tetratricopeptide (TPR) repeat protein
MCGFSQRVAASLLCLTCGSVAMANMKDELLERGKSLCGQRDYDAAIKVFANVLEVDPKCTEAHYGRGSAYLCKGDYDAAISDLSEVVRQDPRHSGAYRGRGIAHLGKGHLSMAIMDLSEAIRIDPEDTAAYCGRSTAHLAKQESRFFVPRCGPP